MQCKRHNSIQQCHACNMEIAFTHLGAAFAIQLHSKSWFKDGTCRDPGNCIESLSLVAGFDGCLALSCAIRCLAEIDD
jgi:hypothetical protein